jgi:hypothetical protein
MISSAYSLTGLTLSPPWHRLQNCLAVFIVTQLTTQLWIADIKHKKQKSAVLPGSWACTPAWWQNKCLAVIFTRVFRVLFFSSKKINALMHNTANWKLWNSPLKCHRSLMKETVFACTHFHWSHLPSSWTFVLWWPGVCLYAMWNIRLLSCAYGWNASVMLKSTFHYQGLLCNFFLSDWHGMHAWHSSIPKQYVVYQIYSECCVFINV